MSWEVRGNVRYYTRTYRRHGRVIREYIGTGPVAEAAAQVDAQRRTALLRQREQERAERAEWAAAEAVTGAATQLASRLFQATLLAAGYHQHARSSWRKRKHVPASDHAN